MIERLCSHAILCGESGPRRINGRTIFLCQNWQSIKDELRGQPGLDSSSSEWTRCSCRWHWLQSSLLYISQRLRVAFFQPLLPSVLFLAELALVHLLIATAESRLCAGPSLSTPSERPEWDLPIPSGCCASFESSSEWETLVNMGSPSPC